MTNASDELGSGGRSTLDRAISNLRQAIVVSALQCTYSPELAGKIVGLDIENGESLEEYEARLVARYGEIQKTLEIPAAPAETERGSKETSSHNRRFWKRVVGFLTFGLYRPGER